MRHYAGWIVVRTILVADVGLLVLSGFISLIWVAEPGGILVAAALWLLSGGLLGLLPLTDPYRVEQRRLRKWAAALNTAQVTPATARPRPLAPPERPATARGPERRPSL
jgi:hypothetical protein